MKIVKMYLTSEEIKDKLGKEYKNSNVLFTKSEIGLDNTLTFECIVTDEEINIEHRRDKLELVKNKYFYENVLKMMDTTHITFDECLLYLLKAIDLYKNETK